MAFVKLDCAMLNSSIWPEKAQRDLFITALLMAEPHELREPTPQLYVSEIKPTGWTVPPGWYGFVRAASVGIIHSAMIDRTEGLIALEQLGQPDPSSKSKDYEGRRMVRIDGGFIILNYVTYRERDFTAAERSKRWRERQKKKKQSEEEKRAKERANGETIRPEHRDDYQKAKPKRLPRLMTPTAPNV
jgi:hypothetical protein